MESIQEKRSVTKDWALLCALILWGYCFFWQMPASLEGLALTLFALAGAALCLGYALLTGVKPAPSSYVYLAALVLLALSFGLFENSGIAMPLFLLLLPLLALWLVHSVQPKALSPWDIPAALGLLIIRPFETPIEKAKRLLPQGGDRKHIHSVLLGIGLTLPVLVVAFLLLSNADPYFAQLIASLVGDWELAAFRLVAGCIVAVYFFSMLMSAHKPALSGKKWVRPSLSPTVTAILLGSLSALYLLFLALQGAELLGVLGEAQRSAAFYSEYVRDGFFSLCGVTLLNLAVFLGAHLLRTGTAKGQQLLLTLLGVLTQLIILTAMLKMGLYMGRYGLTLLRVQTMWFMGSLFIVFMLLIIRQWRTFAAFKQVAALAMASILLAAYCNIGGMVAKVNVDRYLRGSLAEFDIDPYWEFPYEAAPHLCRLYEETLDAEVKEAAGAFLASYFANADTAFTAGQSLQRHNAIKEGKAFCETYGLQAEVR